MQSPKKTWKIMSANLNGIRAAHRRGFFDWVATLDLDCICVQETKAQMHAGLKASFEMDGYTSYFVDAEKKGYSGVGIYTRHKPIAVETSMNHELADSEGRFIELDFGKLRVASIYLPSGTSGQVRQDIKMALLDDFYRDYLQPHVNDKTERILCGDWNIAHRPEDLKNWRQNQGNSGFLPEERAWLDLVFEQTGWVDAYRHRHPDKTQYTWWSYRAQAREKDVGWRIDYQVVSPTLADKIIDADVFREPIFSDHAPLVVTYEIDADKR